MNLLRVGASLGLALHGFVHLIGFVVPWRFAAVEGYPYRTTLLNTALEVGEGGARIVGLAWLALVLGFLVAAAAVWLRKRWALRAVMVLAVASLAVCALGLPEAAPGIAVNLAILGLVAGLAVTRRAGVT